jgi:hypothetical protein
MLKITSSDSVDDFLGVNILYTDGGKISYAQPRLIPGIIDDLGLKEDSVTKDVPALLTKILRKYTDSIAFNKPRLYCSVIGKLDYLESSMHPDIAYAVYQCARYSANSKYEHGKAVKEIGRYLLATKHRVVHITPKYYNLECHANADYAGE